jgi:hypothetical protein
LERADVAFRFARAPFFGFRLVDFAAEGQHELAIGVELLHAPVAEISDIKIAGRVECHANRAGKAPAPVGGLTSRAYIASGRHTNLVAAAVLEGVGGGGGGSSAES